MINVDDILVRWVPYVVGARSAIVVEAIDFQTATAAACGVGPSGALPEKQRQA
jgi:hypothetical protein